MLNISYTSSGPSIWVNNSRTFRILVGVNGMLLPILLWLFVFLDTGETQLMPSISHYYFTRANSIFIGIMSALSMFLIVYKGEEKKDFNISLIAGLAAICVVLFPTDNLINYYTSDETCPHVITLVNANSFREYFHFIAAAIFLGALAYMSGFIFVKSKHLPDNRGKQKIIRNRIYRVCALMMVLAMVVIFCFHVFDWITEDRYNELKITFWMEVVAVEFFGISWLVKGEAIFGD